VRHREVLEGLAAARSDQVVISTMGSTALWASLSDTPRDFAYIPSSMGQGISLGLGISLSSKQRVVVLSGDGSLLMNLGCLITVASHPAPLTILLINNGLYEVTGGQSIVGASTTDFAGLARAAGILNVFTFDDAASWKEQATVILSQSGPTFVWLKVDGLHGQKTPSPPRPMSEQLQRLQGALQT
jgi:sulfopyruvate decarboxylase subunit beta